MKNLQAKNQRMGNVTPDSTTKKSGSGTVPQKTRKRTYTESKSSSAKPEASTSKSKDKPKKAPQTPKNATEKQCGAKRKTSLSNGDGNQLTPKKSRLSRSFDESPMMQKPLTERQQLAYLLEMTARESMEDSLSQEKEVKNGPSDDAEKKTPKTEKKSVSKINKRNERGETQMHLLAIRGDVEGIKKLITQGADVNVTDYAGWTPLHEACNRGHYKIVKVLLKAGALVTARGLDGDTPLHDASSNGHMKIVSALLRYGADPSLKNHHGETPIDVAASDEVEEILENFSLADLASEESEADKENGCTSSSVEAVEETEKSEEIKGSDAGKEDSSTADENSSSVREDVDKEEKETVSKDCPAVINDDSSDKLIQVKESKGTSNKKKKADMLDHDNVIGTSGTLKEVSSTTNGALKSCATDEKAANIVLASRGSEPTSVANERDSDLKEAENEDNESVKTEGSHKVSEDSGYRSENSVHGDNIYDEGTDDEKEVVQESDLCSADTSMRNSLLTEGKLKDDLLADGDKVVEKVPEIHNEKVSKVPALEERKVIEEDDNTSTTSSYDNETIFDKLKINQQESVDPDSSSPKIENCSATSSKCNDQNMNFLNFHHGETGGRLEECSSTGTTSVSSPKRLKMCSVKSPKYLSESGLEDSIKIDVGNNTEDLACSLRPLNMATLLKTSVVDSKVKKQSQHSLLTVVDSRKPDDQSTVGMKGEQLMVKRRTEDTPPERRKKTAKTGASKDAKKSRKCKKGLLFGSDVQVHENNLNGDKDCAVTGKSDVKTIVESSSLAELKQLSPRNVTPGGTSSLPTLKDGHSVDHIDSTIEPDVKPKVSFCLPDEEDSGKVLYCNSNQNDMSLENLVQCDLSTKKRNQPETENKSVRVMPEGIKKVSTKGKGSTNVTDIETNLKENEETKNLSNSKVGIPVSVVMANEVIQKKQREKLERKSNSPCKMKKVGENTNGDVKHDQNDERIMVPKSKRRKKLKDIKEALPTEVELKAQGNHAALTTENIHNVEERRANVASIASLDKVEREEQHQGSGIAVIGEHQQKEDNLLEREQNKSVGEKDVKPTLKEKEVKTNLKEKEVKTTLKEKDVKTTLKEKEVKTTLKEKEVKTTLKEKEVKTIAGKTEALNFSQHESKVNALRKEPILVVTGREGGKIVDSKKEVVEKELKKMEKEVKKIQVEKVKKYRVEKEEKKNIVAKEGKKSVMGKNNIVPSYREKKLSVFKLEVSDNGMDSEVRVTKKSTSDIDENSKIKPRKEKSTKSPMKHDSIKLENNFELLVKKKVQEEVANLFHQQLFGTTDIKVQRESGKDKKNIRDKKSPLKNKEENVKEHRKSAKVKEEKKDFENYVNGKEEKYKKLAVDEDGSMESPIKTLGRDENAKAQKRSLINCDMLKMNDESRRDIKAGKSKTEGSTVKRTSLKAKDSINEEANVVSKRNDVSNSRTVTNAESLNNKMKEVKDTVRDSSKSIIVDVTSEYNDTHFLKTEESPTRLTNLRKSRDEDKCQVPLVKTELGLSWEIPKDTCQNDDSYNPEPNTEVLPGDEKESNTFPKSNSALVCDAKNTNNKEKNLKGIENVIEIQREKISNNCELNKPLNGKEKNVDNKNLLDSIEGKNQDDVKEEDATVHIKEKKRPKRKAKKCADVTSVVNVCEADTGMSYPLHQITNDSTPSSAFEDLGGSRDKRPSEVVSVIRETKTVLEIKQNENKFGEVSTTHPDTDKDACVSYPAFSNVLANASVDNAPHPPDSLEKAVKEEKEVKLSSADNTEARLNVSGSIGHDSKNSVSSVSPPFLVPGDNTENIDSSCQPPPVATATAAENSTVSELPDSSSCKSEECPEKKIIEIGIEIVESYGDSFDNISHDLISPKASTSFESITPSITCTSKEDYLLDSDAHMVDIALHHDCDSRKVDDSCGEVKEDTSNSTTSTTWDSCELAEIGSTSEKAHDSKVQSGIISMSGAPETSCHTLSINDNQENAILNSAGPFPDPGPMVSSNFDITQKTVDSQDRNCTNEGASTSVGPAPSLARTVDLEPCDIVRTMLNADFPDCNDTLGPVTRSTLPPDSTCLQDMPELAERLETEVTSTGIDRMAKRHEVCSSVALGQNKGASSGDVVVPKRRPKSPPLLSTWRQVINAKCKFLKFTDEELSILKDSLLCSGLYQLRGSELDNTSSMGQQSSESVLEKLSRRQKIELEKLHLCMEQELLRIQSRCKLLWSEKVPVSACSAIVFQEDEIYRKLPENVALRCHVNHVEDIENLRVALINDILERYIAIEKNLLTRHRLEREGIETQARLWKLFRVGRKGLMKGKYRRMNQISALQ